VVVVVVEEEEAAAEGRIVTKDRKRQRGGTDLTHGRAAVIQAPEQTPPLLELGVALVAHLFRDRRQRVVKSYMNAHRKASGYNSAKSCQRRT